MTNDLMAVGLAGCVAVVGMPHGGLDHLFGRAALEPATGRWWRPAFASLYLGLAGFILAGWMIAPALTVLLFFLVSAYHFGSADGRHGWRGVVEGGSVIWIPLLARPLETSELLAWVIPGGQTVTVIDWVLAARPILGMVALAFVYQVFCVWRSGDWATSARLMGFAVAFVVLPVLVSFGLFFCGWHSTRELWALAHRAIPGNPRQGLGKVIRLAAPRAILAVVAAGAAAWWFAAGHDLSPVVVQAVFIGLSAVAVPHIVLHAIAEGIGADPFTGRVTA